MFTPTVGEIVYFHCQVFVVFVSQSQTETAADLHFKTSLRISSLGHYGVGHAGADVDVLVVRVVIQCDFYT